MKIESWIPIYEIDGKDADPVPRPQMSIETHWNWHDRAVLYFDGKKVTVMIKDLEAALSACRQRAR